MALTLRDMESRADDGMDTSGDLETYRQTKMKEIEGLEQRIRSSREALDRLKDCNDERIRGRLKIWREKWMGLLMSLSQSEMQ